MTSTADTLAPTPTATSTPTTHEPTRAARPDQQQLDVRPLTAAIGATVEGLDVRSLDDGQRAALRRAVVTHRVVFVRGQDLDDAGLRDLARAFGVLGRSPLHRLLGTDRTTSLIEDTAERPPAGFDWHTDLSWTAAPPAFGFLHALEIPPYGGDTIWVSQVAAFRSLDPAVQQRCLELGAEHRCDRSLLASVERHHGPEVALALRRANRPIVHPLVRRHDETGEAGLFLSPMYLRRLVGIDRQRGAYLLRQLDATLLEPHHQVRWRWRAGDVAIWDETTTCHRALTDHHPQRRLMRRCVVEGGVPVGVGPR